MAASGTHGKRFEKDFLASLRSMGHWAERFRDNTWASMAGSNESPPDMIAVINGKPVLLELKAITTGINTTTGEKRDLMLGGISEKRCEGHQLQRLLDFEAGGHGRAFVLVMFYTPGAVRRCAVMIPLGAWTGYRDLYGSGTLRLDVLRTDLPAHFHFKWVGRKAKIGPWDRCHSLGNHPDHDISVQEHIIHGRHVPRH